MRILTISQLATECGVASSAISGFLKRKGAEARVGDRVDADHPVILEYRARQEERRAKVEERESALPPKHPRFDDAVELFIEKGRCSARLIEQELAGVGRASAKAIIEQINARGMKFGGKKKPDGYGSERNYQRGPEFREKKEAAAAPAATPAPATTTSAGPTQVPDATLPENVEAYADYTLRQIAARFGTMTRFTDYLSALKKLEDITVVRLKNEAATGRLVNRDLVEKGVIDPVDAAFNRMLTDGAKAIAMEAHNMALAGMDVTEIEQAVEKVLSSFIRPAKAKIRKGLKHE